MYYKKGVIKLGNDIKVGTIRTPDGMFNITLWRNKKAAKYHTTFQKFNPKEGEKSPIITIYANQFVPVAQMFKSGKEWTKQLRQTDKLDRQQSEVGINIQPE